MVKEIYPEMEDLFYKYADYRNATESYQIAAVLQKVIEISAENRQKLEQLGETLEKLEMTTD